MKKIFSITGILFMVYVVGLAVFIIYLIGRLTGKIILIGAVPKLRPKLMMISNHADIGGVMGEVFLASMPFYPQVFMNPFRFAPYFTLDQKNFTDKWYWSWLKPRAISVQRGISIGHIREIRTMIEVLKNFTGWIIHFFEGGRTRNGDSFIVSKSGKKIRTPSDSVGWMVDKIKARILPMWIENGNSPQQPTKKLFSFPCFFSWLLFNREPIIIKIGKVISPWDSVKMKPDEITAKISLSLLELADQE